MIGAGLLTRLCDLMGGPAGAVCEELEPVQRPQTGEVSGLSPMGAAPHWSRGSRDSLTAHDEDHGEAAISCSPLTVDSSGNPLLLARLGTRGGIHCNVKHYNLAQKD